MTESAELVHAVPGRVRLRVPGRRGDRAFLERLGESLRPLGRVRVNPLTGSVLVEGRPSLSWREVADLGGKAGLVDLRPAPAAAPEPEGIGLQAAGALALVVLAIVQIARGQVLGPASNLLWYALELIREPQRSPSARSVSSQGSPRSVRPT